jgi:hypothetical protein
VGVVSPAISPLTCLPHPCAAQPLATASPPIAWTAQKGRGGAHRSGYNAHAVERLAADAALLAALLAALPRLPATTRGALDEAAAFAALLLVRTPPPLFRRTEGPASM